MSISDRYADGASRSEVPSSFASQFDWTYGSDEDLLRLYEKAKKKQWNATSRIDWSIELDPENPLDVPDATIPLAHSETFRKMNAARKAEFRMHYHAWRVSQFLHGEQGALVCSAKAVQQSPTIGSKLFAASQVIDEARHVEAYSRLLREKFQVAYPVVSGLKALLDDVISDSRWDMTYLGMQVLIEGLALAAFSSLRDMTRNPLVSAVNAYVMEDEARHVAFGRSILRNYYRELSTGERRQREEFAAEACLQLRSSLDATPVADRFGISDAEMADSKAVYTARSRFRSALFKRIVPTLQDIGLWGHSLEDAYRKMGIAGLAGVDLDALMQQDEMIAEAHDSRAREYLAAVAGSSDASANEHQK